MSGRLYRSRTEHVIAGVAGGVADYLNIDPALVRIVWAILIFVTGGLFLLVYVVMWIVVAEAPRGTWAPAQGVSSGEPDVTDEQRPFMSTDHGDGNMRLIFGLVLIGLGVYFLLRNYLPVIAWGRLWPVLLVLAGAALLIASMHRHDAG